MIAIDSTGDSVALIGGFLDKDITRSDDLEERLPHNEMTKTTLHYATRCRAFTISKRGTSATLPQKEYIRL